MGGSDFSAHRNGRRDRYLGGSPSSRTASADFRVGATHVAVDMQGLRDPGRASARRISEAAFGAEAAYASGCRSSQLTLAQSCERPLRGQFPRAVDRPHFAVTGASLIERREPGWEWGDSY
jgi:hypothetical protein